MRVIIDAHLRARIEQLAAELGTDNPRVAVNHVLALWARGALAQAGSPPGPSLASPSVPPREPDLDALIDWGSELKI